MAGGRPRKPDHLKVVAGTDQPCRMNPNAPVPSTALPDPPEFLSHRAAEWFRRVLAILVGMGIASADHVDMLALGAMAFDEFMDATAAIEDLGMVYHEPIFGLFEDDGETPKLKPKMRPEVRIRADAFRRLKSILAEFGLSPATVAKVSVPPGQSADPFAEFA